MDSSTVSSGSVAAGHAAVPGAPAAGRAAELVPYLVGRTSRAFDRAWLASLRPHGVTLPRWQVLAVLAEYDGARLGEIAALTSAQQSVTSRVVDQMERDGLVERRAAADDRRAVEVHLTDRGRALYDELLPEAQALVHRATAGLDEAAAQALLQLMTGMLEQLQDDDAEPDVATALPLAQEARP